MHQAKWNRVAEKISFNLEVDIKRFRNEVNVEHRVLDYGCGYGRIGRLLLASGYKNVVGIDSSKAMIERGRRECPELTFEIATGSLLPFYSQSFDAVVACAVFTCITDKEIRRSQAMELCRILKPGGLLHMVEFCSQSDKSFTASMGVPMLHSSTTELRNLIGAFEIVSQKVTAARTLNDNEAERYSVFARKPLAI